MMDKKKKVIANGFILADAVLGMFILVVSVMAIAGLYMQSQKSNLFADNQTVAYNWAQQRMEELKATSAWRGDSTTPTAPDPTLVPDIGTPPRTGFTRTASANVAVGTIATLPATTVVENSTLVTATNTRLVDVVVTVSWKESGKDRSIKLETLMERE